MYTRLVALILIVLLAASGLAVVPFAGAQEGPPQVGLRPDAPTYALHGPYWVGVMKIEAETPYRLTKGAIWYPALNLSGAEEITTYDFDYYPDKGILPIAGHALRDALPDTSGGPYPLVIYVHGYNHYWAASSWLCEHLASYGFVAIALDQFDNQGAQGQDFAESLLRRPQEVTWQIDYAATLTAANGLLEGLIDVDSVAVTGASMGGYTTLMAGGAQFDWDHFKTWCQENRDRAFAPTFGANMCDIFNISYLRPSLAAVAGIDLNQGGLWPSWGDSRIDAIIPLVPAYWPFWGPEGMKNITIPMLVMGGSGDRTLVPPMWDLIYETAGSAQKTSVIFANADHPLTNVNCEAAPWLPDILGYGDCSDPVWDKERAQDLLNHFATAFLLATLKGDADAAAALTPDAAVFPGIIYEAQGF